MLEWICLLCGKLNILAVTPIKMFCRGSFYLTNMSVPAGSTIYRNSYQMLEKNKHFGTWLYYMQNIHLHFLKVFKNIIHEWFNIGPNCCLTCFVYTCTWCWIYTMGPSVIYITLLYYTHKLIFKVLIHDLCEVFCSLLAQSLFFSPSFNYRYASCTP